MFEGFSEQTREFLWGLAFHNERPWFQEHKEEFERVLKRPFQALAEETLAAFAALEPDRDWQLHISRIYRDARRLFGRGPYKEHLWFSIKEDTALLSGVMFWFEIGAEDFAYGMGFYDATAAQMTRLREAVLLNPGALTELAEALNAQDRFELNGPLYKRPKVQAGAPLDDWLNRKYLALSHREEFGPALYDPELPRHLAEAFAWLVPYYEFLKTYGAPDPAHSFRAEEKETEEPS